MEPARSRLKVPAPIPGDSDFFRVFARIEYALKDNRYARWINPRRKVGVKVDWDQFVTDNKEALRPLFAKAKEDETIRYLIEHPPHAQIVTDEDRADFGDAENVTDTPSLIRAARNVRNNLFHGGKSYSKPPPDPEHDAKLIRASVGVLELMLDRCKRLRETFDPNPS
jgi:hypothetical protein